MWLCFYVGTYSSLKTPFLSFRPHISLYCVYFFLFLFFTFNVYKFSWLTAEFMEKYFPVADFSEQSPSLNP